MGLEDFKQPGDNDYFEQLALGEFPERSFVYKFGRVLTVLGKRKPAWDGPGTYTFPETAGKITITSNNAADAAAGDGARELRIFGLNENWEQVTEVVPIGGTTQNDYIRVHRLWVEKSGLTEFPYNGTEIGNNVGTITATHPVVGAVAIILPGNGQTLMAIFTIPAGYVGLMWAANTAIGKAKDAVGYLFTRTAGANNPWRVKGIRDMYQNEVGIELKIPGVYEEKTDIVMALQGSDTGSGVSATFQLELVKVN